MPTQSRSTALLRITSTSCKPQQLVEAQAATGRVLGRPPTRAGGPGAWTSPGRRNRAASGAAPGRGPPAPPPSRAPRRRRRLFPSRKCRPFLTAGIWGPPDRSIRPRPRRARGWPSGAGPGRWLTFPETATSMPSPEVLRPPRLVEEREAAGSSRSSDTSTITTGLAPRRAGSRCTLRTTARTVASSPSFSSEMGVWAVRSM